VTPWLFESFKIENAGTDSFVNPSVEVYLTPLRMGWASSRYLATKNYTTTIPPFNTHYFSMGSATVPASVPTGIYYLGLYLRDDGRYDFSVCPNDGVGGSADPGDGDFRMYDSSGTMLWYIDGSVIRRLDKAVCDNSAYHS
jgi:hypothetical protein